MEQKSVKFQSAFSVSQSCGPHFTEKQSALCSLQKAFLDGNSFEDTALKKFLFAL